MEVTTLDNFCPDRQLPDIKLLKADVEGMGLDMLSGSENTIRRNRPFLSLSIYNNRDEPFGTYKKLQSWNLNYHFIAGNFLHNVAGPTSIAWTGELDNPI